MSAARGEIRGVWQRIQGRTRAEIAALVEAIDAAHFNVFFPEIVCGSVSITDDPTGLYTKSLELGALDGLAAIVEECHQRGIEVHAWLQCFSIGLVGSSDEPALLADFHPDWLAQSRSGSQGLSHMPALRLLSPAHPDARRALIEAAASLAERHDLDGIQIDHARFEFPDKRGDDWDFSVASRARAKSDLGFDPIEIGEKTHPEEWERWLAWREEIITSFVGEMSEAIRAVKPNLVVSAAVYPEVTKRRRDIGQNWSQWLQRGFIDAAIPMIYSQGEGDVERGVAELAEHSTAESATVVGLGPFIGLTPEELVDQIVSARSAGATGQCIFAWDTLGPDHTEQLVKRCWPERTGVLWKR